MAKKLLCFLLVILFVLAGFCYSRPVTITDNSWSNLVSDGVQIIQQPTALLVKSLLSSETCEPKFGLFPCSRTALENIFLILVYGYLMSTAAKFLSEGSEGLLEILGPGIVGGLVLPVLSSLPDAMVVLASGLSGSKEEAQSKVLVGMGLQAGLTVMTLTILWGTFVVVGKCDLLPDSTPKDLPSGDTKEPHGSLIAQDLTDTKGFSLTGSGVSTDIWTCYASRIMLLSVLPFIVVQVPQYFCTYSQSRLAILISLILSISLLFYYCLYQVFRPWIQRRRLAYAKHKHVITGLLKHLSMDASTNAFGRFLREDGTTNTEVLEMIFHSIDANGDGSLSALEIRALIIGIQFDQALNNDDVVDRVMKEFDTSQDSLIDLPEFIDGIERWLKYSNPKRDPTLFSDLHQQAKKEQNLLGDEDDEKVEKNENAIWNGIMAILALHLGTIIAAVFADSFADAVSNFSAAVEVPPFFVAFIVHPFVRYREGVAAIMAASRKKKRDASLTYSQVYAAVTVSHLLCLSVFLSLVYIRELTWNFSAEVSIIIIVALVVGGCASFRTTFRLWKCLVAYALYPLSLLLVYIIHYVIKLS